MPLLYIGHPASQYAGDPSELVGACVKNPDGHGGCPLRPCEYASNCSLNAQDFCSMVRQRPGPILLINPVQKETVGHIRLRMGARVPVVVADIGTVDELRAAILEVCRQHEDGEPLLALDVVVALLMMRKLDQEHMWTGNAKGYMWGGDIPKGRGLDQKYAGRVAHVLNILLQRGLVVSKISNSKNKYALNPDMRPEIYDILRNREFPDHVQHVLLRHGELESVRALDLLDDYDNGPPRDQDAS